MKQGRLRYWLRLTLFTPATLDSGMLLLIFVIAPVRAADVMMHPPRMPVCCQTPADFGLQYEEVAFPTSDGLTLRGWYIPGQIGGAILFAHGGGVAGQDLEREAVCRYFAATSEPKSLWEIPEGSHAYTWAARPQEYTQRIVEFFTQSLLK